MSSSYETVIGLEIHVQLNTKSKAFCRDTNRFGDNANTNISEVSLALPGTLPNLNRSQVLSAIKLGVSLDCDINKNSRFDRKNYTYPDLPKGYQITQDQKPICIGGQFTFKTGENYKTIRLHHIHMEEDAGKSIHDIDKTLTCLDYNRAGTPLLEVVTEPDFRSGQEVSDFMSAFQTLIRYIDISDANMEEGSLRCDCNVSVRTDANAPLGTRAEVKNVNSKKFAKQAIEFEAERQWGIITAGGEVIQETRLFEAESGKTYSMRKKEDALDYRYFPDPDLQSIIIADKVIKNIKNSIEFLPWEAEKNLKDDYGITPKVAETISQDKSLVYLFLEMVKDIKNNKLVSNFIVNQFITIQNKITNADYGIKRDVFTKMLMLINDDKLSASTAYTVLIPIILKTNEINIEQIAKDNNIFLESTGIDLGDVCKEIMNKFPDKVKAYQNGKKGLIGFFMGQFMKSGGKGLNPKDVQKEFENLLNEKPV